MSVDRVSSLVHKSEKQKKVLKDENYIFGQKFQLLLNQNYYLIDFCQIMQFYVILCDFCQIMRPLGEIM